MYLVIAQMSSCASLIGILSYNPVMSAMAIEEGVNLMLLFSLMMIFMMSLSLAISQNQLVLWVREYAFAAKLHWLMIKRRPRLTIDASLQDVTFLHEVTPL